MNRSDSEKGQGPRGPTTSAATSPHGVESGGPLALHELERLANGHSLAEFEAAFPAPALVLGQYIAQRAPEAVPRKTRRFGTFKAGSLDLLRYVDKVVFVAKRPGSAFPDTVFIGRTRTNDVVLDVQSVSKLHGRFEKQGSVWYFTDAGSSLGTWLNGQRLEPERRYALATSDDLRIGPDLVALFLLAPDLRRYGLRRS